MGFGSLFAIAALMWSLIPAWAAGNSDSEFTEIDSRIVGKCDAGVLLSNEERKFLIEKLRISIAGRDLLADFVKQYGSLKKLVIQWDSVSYSQVTHFENDRSPASAATTLGPSICIHLAKKLPPMEHLADFAHELAHATRLDQAVLRGDVDSVEEFVKMRLTARGGEADAFAIECAVKNDLLGKWDSFCAPYVRNDRMSIEAVIKDLYSGNLSASLTGETYPVMLGRQFKLILEKRARQKNMKNLKYSALENKAGIQ